LAAERHGGEPDQERRRAEYQVFASRLSEFNMVHLFVDGLAERLHSLVDRATVPGRPFWF